MCLSVAKQRRKRAKNVIARGRSAGICPESCGQEPAVINRGWMHVDARKWVEPCAGWAEEKRAIEKLDSEFIIANARRPQPLAMRGCSGARTRSPSLQMHILWVPLDQWSAAAARRPRG